MADLIKDSYVEANLHTKVIVQRGRDVVDFELNEMQDIIRVMAFRQFFAGVQGGTLNPGVVDESWQAVENVGDNSNKVAIRGKSTSPLRTGYIFCDGIPIFHDAPDEVVTGFVTNTSGSTTYDGLYLTVEEREVADPAQVPQLGETTRRRKLVLAWHIEVGDGAVPVPPGPVWEGGVHYYKVARITRPDGDNRILSSYIQDTRCILPPAIINAITRQGGGVVQAVVANTLETGDGGFGKPISRYQIFDVDARGDFTGEKGWLWEVNRDSSLVPVAQLIYSPSVFPYTSRAFILTGGNGVFGAAGTLALWDGNTQTSLAKVMRLSSNVATDGDNTVRTFNADAGVNSTLLKSINGRWTVTVGDGTHSFGDFNGAYAIYDAVKFFKDYVAASSHTCHIQIKTGAYTLDETHSIDVSGSTLILEGADRDNTSVYWSNTSASPIKHVLGRLELYGLTFLTITATQYVVVDKRTGTIKVDSCRFLGGVVKLTDIYQPQVSTGECGCLVRDSFILSTVGDLPCVEILTTVATPGGNYHTPVSVHRSFLQTIGAAPAFLYDNTVVGGMANDLIVRDCEIVTGTPLAPHSYAGVVGVRHGAVASMIYNIIVEDCKVTGEQLLIFAHQNTTYVNSLTLRRIRFTCSGAIGGEVNTAFYVGNNPINDSIISVGYLTIEDVELFYLGAYFSTLVFDDMKSGSHVFSKWGTVTIGTVRQLTIRGLRIFGVATKSRCGELLVYKPKAFDIEGVILTPTDLTPITSSYPMFRSWIVGHATMSDLRRASVTVNYDGAGQVVDSFGSLVACTPYGKMELRDSSILLPAATTVTEQGFLLATDYSFTGADTAGMTTEKCSVEVSGNRPNFTAFAAYADWAHALDKYTYRGNSVNGSMNVAININGYIGRGVIDDNKIIGTFNSHKAIVVNQSFTGSRYAGTVAIRNNYISMWTSAYNPPPSDWPQHIYISSDTEPPSGHCDLLIIGNTTVHEFPEHSGVSYVDGTIRVPEVLAEAALQNIHTQGVYTGFVNDSGTVKYEYTNTKLMALNRAYLNMYGA